MRNSRKTSRWRMWRRNLKMTTTRIMTKKKRKCLSRVLRIHQCFSFQMLPQPAQRIMSNLISKLPSQDSVDKKNSNKLLKELVLSTIIVKEMLP
jgi:hypothetical protein